MGYGQYSSGGGLNRRKDDMILFATGDIASSRKGGKNRLHFIRTDGSQGFILHETIVAELSADRKTLTLADGGWHTLTTKAAWGDALNAFGIRLGISDIPYTRLGLMPRRDERRVVYKVDNGCVLGRDETAPKDHPMLRASTDDGDNVEVHYNGRALTTGIGYKVDMSPKLMLTYLYWIDELIRKTHGMVAPRGSVLYQFGFDMLFRITPGQTSKTVMVGCHAFRSADVRSFMRQIEGLYPEAVKSAKTFVRKHPKDFKL